MFLKPNAQVDPRQKALDSALMLLVHKKMSETGRENRRNLKTKYPPARNGATNFEPGFTSTPKAKKGWGTGATLNDLVEGGFKPPTDNSKMPFDMSWANQRPVVSTGNTMFNPNVKLDPSQVEDRRYEPTHLERIAALFKSGAMSGNEQFERPAPAFGMALAPDGYPEQSAPAGGSSKEALIQMLMQRMKSGSFLR